MTQALRILRDRTHVLALIAIVLVVWFGLPDGDPKTIFKVPIGIQLLGVVAGMTIAFHAIGVILVYRANRIINFAQVQIGIVAATFFSVFAAYAPHITRWIPDVCGFCFERGLTKTTYWVNYYLILVLSLALSIGLGWLIYQVVIRRFSEAPRLVLTVATIFLAQLLAGAQGFLSSSGTIFSENEIENGIQLRAVPPSWTANVKILATFQAPDILIVVIGILVIVALGLYLRLTPTGVAIRAVADNPSRLETLGVNVNSVMSRVWMIAAFLSTTAALLTAMKSGVGGGGLSVGVLIRILAAAVIARMYSLWIAGLAAVSFGVLEQAFLWVFKTTVLLDGILVFIIAAVLLAQRHKASRAELEQASEWRAAREARPIPKELRDLEIVKRWVLWSAIIGGSAVLGLPWLMSPSQTNLLAAAMIYTIVFISLLVLTGWAGQISLGQFGFAAVGGYIAAVTHLPLLLALIVGGLAGAATAVIIGLPALKMRGLHLAITTMAFSLSVTQLLLNPRYGGKALPTTLETPHLLGLDLEDQRVFYYFTMVLLALVVAAVMGMRRSRFGRSLIAARDNEPAAQSFGINLVAGRLTAFAIAGFIAAFGGALFAFHQHGVRATAYPPEESLQVFLITVIGGMGSLAGPMFAMVYRAVLFVTGASPLFQILLTGVGGLALIYLVPGGLAQLWFSIRDAVLRWIARRNRIVVPSLIADVARQDGRETVSIAPKTRRGGGEEFVPERYRLEDQWSVRLIGNGNAKKKAVRG